MKIIDVRLTPHDKDICAKVTFLDEGVRWSSAHTSNDPSKAVELAIKAATDELCRSLINRVSIKHTVAIAE